MKMRAHHFGLLRLKVSAPVIDGGVPRVVDEVHDIMHETKVSLQRTCLWMLEIP
jgi:hypothetical protein